MMVPGWTDYAREWVRLPFLLIAERLNIWTEVEGRLRIAALTGSDEDDRKCVARLLGALDVIRGHSPHRYRRLLADVRRILVFTGRRKHIRATYTERLHMCLIDASYVLDPQTSDIDIAGTLVHEATHARLGLAGVRHTRRRLLRIEQACLTEQLRFYRRLPHAGRQIAEAERTIAEWRSPPRR